MSWWNATTVLHYGGGGCVCVCVGGGMGGIICDFSADYPRQHSVRILGSILFCWLANIVLIWSRQDYFTHFEPSQS